MLSLQGESCGEEEKADVNRRDKAAETEGEECHQEENKTQ